MFHMATPLVFVFVAFFLTGRLKILSVKVIDAKNGILCSFASQVRSSHRKLLTQMHKVCGQMVFCADITNQEIKVLDDVNCDSIFSEYLDSSKPVFDHIPKRTTRRALSKPLCAKHHSDEPGENRRWRDPNQMPGAEIGPRQQVEIIRWKSD
jgi:hypothetical protein